MVVYLASVLIPFLAFYFTAGYAIYDLDMYAHRNAVVASQEVFVSMLITGDSRCADPDALHRSDRRRDRGRPRSCCGGCSIASRSSVGYRSWSLPALYLEVLWIYTAFRIGNEYLPKARGVAWKHPDLAGHHRLGR